jgi:isoquinoline 1-oxidoreductase subunit beta
MKKTERPALYAFRHVRFQRHIEPRMNEIPEIVVKVVPTENHPTGVGQMATRLVAPAIANAVAKLAGVRLRETPMTPERVRKALG